MSEGLVEARSEGKPQGGPLRGSGPSSRRSCICASTRRRVRWRVPRSASSWDTASPCIGRRIAPHSVRRLRDRARELLRAGRGRLLPHTIETLNPLRGWINYFQLTESKGGLEELDGWVRRRLRCLLWRQWKRPHSRVRHVRALGLDATRAWHSANNGRGPWWNAGASHMNHALPAAFFARLGLVSLLREQQRLQSVP